MGRSLKTEIWIPIGKWLYHQRDKSTLEVTGNGMTFLLKPIRPGRWKVDGKSLKGVRRRERFDAPDIPAAIEKAQSVLGFLAIPPAENLTIARVLGRWLRSPDVKDETRRGYRGYIKQFLLWCQSQNLVFWKDLALEHLEMYRDYLKESGRKGWTPYHYLKVIRAAGRWAARNWRGTFVDFAEGFKLPKPVSTNFDDENSSLSFEEIGEFLFWLQDQPNGWLILPGVALQSLMALRVSEVLRLTWDRIRWEMVVIDITGEVKNPRSNRRLPIPELALAILEQAPRCGDRVVFRYKEKDGYGRAFRRFYDRWNPTHRIVPSDLRDVLQTEAEIRGWEGYVLDQYCGHAPKNIRQAHYTKVARSQLVDLMREQVVNRVDEILADQTRSWHDLGTVEKVVPLRGNT
jgi:integrase